jgi:hypothetical protein
VRQLGKLDVSGQKVVGRSVRVEGPPEQDERVEVPPHFTGKQQERSIGGDPAPFSSVDHSVDVVDVDPKAPAQRSTSLPGERRRPSTAPSSGEGQEEGTW